MLLTEYPYQRDNLQNCPTSAVLTLVVGQIFHLPVTEKLFNFALLLTFRTSLKAF